MGKLVVMNNSGNEYDNYTYIPIQNTWMNSSKGHNFEPNFYRFNIKYDPYLGLYKVTDNAVPSNVIAQFQDPHQVAAPRSFPEEAPSGTEPEEAPSGTEPADQSVHTRTRIRSRSVTPPPRMDRSGKKSGCEGPGCAVMGGKKKTRRHKSRKQKKSKSKSKSKSKKSTRKK